METMHATKKAKKCVYCRDGKECRRPKKNELSHLSERTKGTEEITRLTKGVALSSKKAAYTPSVPSKNETMPSVVVP